MARNFELDSLRQTATCGICLQLYVDARVLSCHHSFCAACLVDYQTSLGDTRCPTCRQETVPQETQQLQQLPKNRLINNLVTFLSEQGEGPVAVRRRASTLRPSRPPPPTLRRTCSGFTRRHRPPQQHSPSIQATEETADNTSQAGEPRIVACAHCDQERGETDAWYKCGVCEHFAICARCWNLPRTQVHDRAHLFIKVKECFRNCPPLRALTANAVKLGKSMKHKLTEHKLIFRRAVSCNRCGVKPIAGVRYKCGICSNYNLCEACEARSDLFHNESHLFVLIEHPSTAKTSQPMIEFSFYKQMIR